MHTIQPCCAQKHMRDLRNAIGKNGTADFMGCGDLSLTELLPAILMRYDDVKMLIAAPSMPKQATEIIAQWMKVQWARMDGRGKVYSIRHLTIIADLSVWKSPVASQWLKENPFGERLTLVDTAQEETAILLPDFAITGPVNMRYGYPFTATATTDPDTVAALWAKFATPAEPELPAATDPTDDTEKPEAEPKAEPKADQTTPTPPRSAMPLATSKNSGGEAAATERADDTEKPEAEEAPKPRKFRRKGANSEGDKPDNSEGVQATPGPS